MNLQDGASYEDLRVELHEQVSQKLLGVKMTKEAQWTSKQLWLKKEEGQGKGYWSKGQERFN